MPDSITKIQDLRRGDIFLGPIGGIPGLIVSAGELLVDGGFRVGSLDVRHAAMVTAAHPGTRYTEEFPSGITDSFELTQAMPGGAETVTMTYGQHWTPRCAYARLPEDFPGQADDAADIALLMVANKVGYSWGSYAALAAWHWGFRTPRLEKWIDRRQPKISYPRKGYAVPPIALPVEAICSVLVDQAWSLAGKRVVEGAAHQAVTPSMLGESLLGNPSVIWGFPSIHPYTPSL